MADKKKKRYKEINDTLNDILRQYQEINCEDIEMFADVYYPIAILEIGMDEKTFEDFELIPYTVLKFIDLGITGAGEIAEVMGLTEKQVNRIISLLHGYGLLEASGLTQQGHESLELKQKVTLNHSVQLFQSDAVTGDLLKLNARAAENNLAKRQDTANWEIAFIPNIEGISAGSVNKQLTETDLNRYKKYKGDILNANTERITAIRCVGIRYAQEYLMKLKDVPVPLIFSAYYDASKKEFKERFGWSLIRSSVGLKEKGYGFAEKYELYDSRAEEIISSIYKLILQKSIKEFPTETELCDKLCGILPFDREKIRVSFKDLQSRNAIVRFAADSFAKWSPALIFLLTRYDYRKNRVLYTNTQLYGQIIELRSDDSETARIAAALQNAVSKYGISKIMKAARQELYNQPTNANSHIDLSNLLKLIDGLNEFDEA